MIIRTKIKITAIILFSLISAIYYKLPATQISDSYYSMLLAESVIKNQEIDLEKYINLKEKKENLDFFYQIEHKNNKSYYYFPHGSSYLSIPFVYVLNKIGFNTIQKNKYLAEEEIKIQRILSAGITAGTVTIIYLIFTVFLSNRVSLCLTFIFAFSTPLVSSLSRGLWSHTWLALLLITSILIVLRNIKNDTQPNPYILATLASWMYFVRPTSSISIIAISILCLIYYKNILFKYLATGFIWLLIFVVYSYYNFETFLPSYYSASRLSSEHLPTAIIGNLLSPSRGLLVYSCFLIPILYLYIKNKKHYKYWFFSLLAFIVMISHLLVISSFPHWWGGHSYGPRFMSDITPWVVAISAITFYEAKYIKKTTIAILILTSIISLFINSWGAYNPESINWNKIPNNIDSDPKRLWDWKYPPFLTGIRQPPVINKLPTIENKKTNIPFNNNKADAFIIDGWSHGESDFRWTVGNISRFGFNLEKIHPILISIKFKPFIELSKNKQKITFYINDNFIDEYRLKSPDIQHITLNVSKEYLVKRNIITIESLDAVSPKSLNVSEDERILGIAIYHVDIEKL